MRKRALERLRESKHSVADDAGAQRNVDAARVEREAQDERARVAAKRLEHEREQALELERVRALKERDLDYGL